MNTHWPATLPMYCGKYTWPMSRRMPEPSPPTANAPTSTNTVMKRPSQVSFSSCSMRAFCLMFCASAVLRSGAASISSASSSGVGATTARRRRRLSAGAGAAAGAGSDAASGSGAASGSDGRGMVVVPCERRHRAGGASAGLGVHSPYRQFDPAHVSAAAAVVLVGADARDAWSPHMSPTHVVRRRALRRLAPVGSSWRCRHAGPVSERRNASRSPRVTSSSMSSG